LEAYSDAELERLTAPESEKIVEFELPSLAQQTTPERDPEHGENA